MEKLAISIPEAAKLIMHSVLGVFEAGAITQLGLSEHIPLFRGVGGHDPQQVGPVLDEHLLSLAPITHRFYVR